MSIGISEEHIELGRTLREWAGDLACADVVRAAEGVADEGFPTVWKALTEMGVATIALPEPIGGGGGSLLDAAVALEACAAAMVPGPLWSTSVAAVTVAGDERAGALLAAGAAVAVAPAPTLVVDADLTGTLDVVWDAAGVTQVLAGARDETGAERWFLIPVEHVTLRPVAGLDLSRRTGSADVRAALADVHEVTGVHADLLHRAALTLAAAEAAGVARWCLDTAVDYAKVREQFGAPIGSFQAIKHLCAQMLEQVEAITAVAWDAAASAGEDAEQWAYAATVAATIALDGAVQVAQDCIQVLGGIGFTFEHDAHLYLRRATALRSLLGSGERHALDLAQRAGAGTRRSVRVDLQGRDDEVRPQIRDLVQRVVAVDEQSRRAVLAETGLLVPHWPTPYGLGADAVTQLVVDEELANAGIARPELKIGAWAVPTILAHGTPEQHERFAAPTLRGELAWCQLFSEPGAGSDLASLRTRAVRVDGGWSLTGQKVWTSLARDAHWAICLARTDPDAPQHRGITYFLVDMTSKGLDTRPLREMTGDAMFNEVFLDDVFVPDDCVVGEVDGGWRLARTTLANERVAMAGTRLGVSTEGAVAALDDTSTPTERVRVGHSVALSTVCALLGFRTTLKALSGQGPGVESSVAKLLGVRSRQESSELLVELLGERVLLGGAEVDAAVHEMLLTRCLSIAGGTTQVLRNVIAERILGLPR